MQSGLEHLQLKLMEEKSIPNILDEVISKIDRAVEKKKALNELSYNEFTSLPESPAVDTKIFAAPYQFCDLTFERT